MGRPPFVLGALRRAALWIPFLCFFPGIFLQAHPISLTASRINVEENSISVKFALMVEDLYFFQEMESTGDARFSRETIKRSALGHGDFLLQYFQLRDGEGEGFDGRIIDIDFADIPEGGVPFGDLMAHWVVYELEFTSNSQPSFLTVFQNFDGDDPRIPSEMDAQIHLDGVEIDQAILSHGAAHTVELDREMDLAALDDEELESFREEMAGRREEDRLGITSYSQVYSFIYITENEVRHEVLLPLLTLASWVPLDREDLEVMTVEEQDAARDRVYQWLRKHNRVRINSTGVTPLLQRLEFFGPDYRDFAREAPRREVSAYNARVGVILSFPAETPPQQLRFEWEHFDKRMPYLTPILYEFEESSRRIELGPRRPLFEWEREREPSPVEFAQVDAPEAPPEVRIPVLSVLGWTAALILAGFAARSSAIRRRGFRLFLAGGCAVAAVAAQPYAGTRLPNPLASPPALDDSAAHSVFQPLLKNIYQAFEYRHEAQTYDALEKSVSGKLLEDLYLQIRQNLKMEEEGGGISRVEEIELINGSHRPVEASPGAIQAFHYETSWTVTGTVEHWGHIHTRRNRYHAIFTVEGFPSGWRITKFDPLQEERLEMRTRLRD